MSADRARPPSPDLDELIVRYWDNALDPAELRQLNDTLATSAEARDHFGQFCLQALSISERFAVARVAATVPRAAPQRSRVVATAVVALLLVATVAVLAWRTGQTPPASPMAPADIARLEDFTGSVQVSGGDGDTGPARLKQPLFAGQTVSVSGTDGTAEIRFTDGTRLLLTGDTAVRVSEDGGKSVHVDHGYLAADVRPQPPGRPMTLTLPETEVQVIGTKLSLSVTKHKSEVAVVRGEVRVTRLADRQSVAVGSGQVATAVAGSRKLVLSQLPDLPDEYSMDFEAPPADWGAGERIDEDLPRGSIAGMRAGPYRTRQFGTQYQVRSQNAWTSGLFLLHSDCWLHMRFHTDRAGFFHVLFVARGDDPTYKRGVVFEAPQFWAKRKPGDWHEVSVPLARMKRLGAAPPNFELPLVVYTVVVNSHLDDVGLTVDRLRVTRGPNLKE